MIVEIFGVSQGWRGATDVNVQCGRAVRRKRNVMRLTECRNLQKSSEPSASRRVGLQNIDRARLEHSPEIIQVVAVFTRGDRHPRWSAITNQP